MPTTYILISSNVLSGNTANVTFSSIPATYTDLILLMSIRTERVSDRDQIAIRFNGDTSSIYSATWMGINGTSGNTAYSSRETTFNRGRIGYAVGSTNTANTFANVEMYLPSYLSTTSKQYSGFSAPENNALTGAWLDANASLYNNTSAISSMLIYSANSANLTAGSSFYLYGIKNS